MAALEVSTVDIAVDQDIITIKGDDIKKMTIQQLQNFQYCLVKFDISDNVFPENILKRTFTTRHENTEVMPIQNKCYIFMGFREFERSPDKIYAIFKNITNDDQYNYQTYIDIKWMVNISNAGIVHSCSELNSYNILAIHITKYLSPNIQQILPLNIKSLVDGQITCINNVFSNISQDIIDNITKYINIQKIYQYVYRNPITTQPSGVQLLGIKQSIKRKHDDE